MDGPTARPADNLPNSDAYGVQLWTVPILTVQVYCQPRLPICQQFSLVPELLLTLSTPRVASTSAELHGPQAGLKLHPPWRCRTLLPGFPVIPLYFVLYPPLYSSLYIPIFTSSNMESTTSQVKNCHSQKNHGVHHKGAVTIEFNNTANLHCRSNVWTIMGSPLTEIMIHDRSRM